MDLHTPLDPEQFGHLRVSTMMRSPRVIPYYCCICGRIAAGKNNFCGRYTCHREATRLEWL